MNHVIRDIASFFKSHWAHILVGIPAAVAFTALHELAHCLAVWVQGGSVTEFIWVPSRGEWGHMRYSFPVGASYSALAVSLSPYVFWVGCCLLVGILALRRFPWSFWAASTLFVWLFIVPVGDIANTAVPYLLWDSENDFRQAFGSTRPAFSIAAVVLGVMVASWGFHINRRLYRDRAVGLPAYCILVVTAALAEMLLLLD